MRFGPTDINDAEGAILAHSTIVGDKRYRKAHHLTSDDIEIFKAAGIHQVVAAILDADDCDEDTAAKRIAVSLRVENIDFREPSTGRVNLYARDAGVFTVDREVIDAINRIDPAITIATLEPFAAVVPGTMVATVKIIPFAVQDALLSKAETLCDQHHIMSVHPFRSRPVGVIQTVLPSIKQSVLDKTLRVTEIRISRSGSAITVEKRIPHHEQDVAAAIKELEKNNDLILIFGASAVCDENDVIPAAIRLAGGVVNRVGMPVDPGNLLVVGTLNGKPVIGSPGCARSPKKNGFDWVLDRLFADMEVTSDTIAGMGVGGLLMEIPTRPHLREEPVKEKLPPKVWGVMLAAGHSRRMKGGNKLLAELDGDVLIHRSTSRLCSSAVQGTINVLGHQAEVLSEALQSLNVQHIYNPDSASGLASSLKTGIRAVPASADGALIALADMPAVTTADYDRLIEAFKASKGQAIIRATHAGKRGNPVILPRSLFLEIEKLEGDTGARQILESSPLETIEVEIGAAASLDVDTPESLAAAGGKLRLNVFE